MFVGTAARLIRERYTMDAYATELEAVLRAAAGTRGHPENAGP